jgi:hypothetical protein
LSSEPLPCRWTRINAPIKYAGWWEAHWPKVALVALVFVVILTIIIAAAAGASSDFAQEIAATPPPPLTVLRRVAPPVVIGYAFEFDNDVARAGVLSALAAYLGIQTAQLAVTDQIAAEHDGPGSGTTTYWNVDVTAANIKAAADIFNRLCDPATPGSENVGSCNPDTKRRRQQTAQFTFISTSFGEYVDVLIDFKEHQVTEMAEKLQALYAGRCAEDQRCSCTPHVCAHTHDEFTCLQDTFGTPDECVGGCGDTTSGRDMDMRQSTLLFSKLVDVTAPQACPSPTPSQ